MNRSRFFVSTVVLLVLTMTVATFAQERERRRRGGRFRRGFGRGMDKTLLLRSDKVREEVKITEEQAKKVDEILESHQEKFRELFSSRPSRDSSEEERAAKRKEFNAKRVELTKKTVAALEAVLEKDQTTRLNEIELQQQGVQGLVSDRGVAALKLSDEQVEKIKSTIKSRVEAVRKLRPRGRRRPDSDEGGVPGVSREEIRAKIDKLNKDTQDAALANLSSEQREAFNKLKGKPFKFDRRRPQRGGDRLDRDRQGGRGRRKRERPPADTEG